jgi:hypothetical protein
LKAPFVENRRGVRLPVRPISRAQLRALRSLLALVNGVARSRVRLTVRPDTAAGRLVCSGDHIELVVRVRDRRGRRDWWAASWSALAPRGVVRRVARRAWERDLP